MKFLANINNFKVDPLGWIGSGIMLIFALIAGYRWYNTCIIFFALLVVRDLIASCLLITRKASNDKINSRSIELLAYVSSAGPFIYFNAAHSLPKADIISSIFTIVGFTISALALLDLGRSFGVSPANRGVVRNGLYSYFQHPMYIGYAISELGFIFINPLNAFIYVLSIGFYFLRAKIENKILNQ